MSDTFTVSKKGGNLSFLRAEGENFEASSDHKYDFRQKPYAVMMFIYFGFLL